MPQATSFDSLLAQCRDLVCDSMVKALADMLDKSDDALGALASQTRDPKSQKLYTVTRNKVSAQRETILTQFRLRYLREFQERGNKVKKIGESFAEIDLSSLELELMADDDLNETLRLNAMADKLREYCDEELVALDQRAGVLLGDANLQAEDNPFTPQAICEAYSRTCHQIDSNVDVRMVMLKLFDDYVLDQIRGIYKAVNAVLVENSILPTIRIVARRGKKGEPPPVAPAPAAPVADKTPAGEQDLFALLQNLVASNLKAAPVAGDALASGTGGGAVGAAGSGGTVVLQGPDLLQSLTRIQVGDVSAVTGGTLSTPGHGGEPDTTNVLRELKGTSVGAGMNRMDAMTLDIVALLFDQLFDDPRIPIGVKGLIGRLQIPMLKIAIADKTFFSKKTHPARLMLDTLGELAVRLPADVNASNPVFANMAAILQELQDEFEDDVEIFVTMRERLQGLIAEADKLIEQETLSTVERVQQNESLALAKTVAQAEIKIRVRGRDVPRSVIEFLIQQWIKLLMIVQVKDGEQSEAWKSALDTMDLLIASVEPKGTPEERRKLVTMVPEVLKRLTEGLKTAGVDDSVRLGFFAELRKLHSEMIAGPEKSRAAVPQAVAEEDGDATIPGLQPIASASAEDSTAVVPAVEPPVVRPDADATYELTPADLPTSAQPAQATSAEFPASVDLTAADAPIAEPTPANAASPDLISFELTPAHEPMADLTPAPEQAVPAEPMAGADAPLDAISLDLTHAELPEAAPVTAAGLHESAPAEAAAEDMPAGVPPLDPMSFELTPVEAAPADPAPAEVSPLDLISFDLPALDASPPATKTPEQATVPDLSAFDLPTLGSTPPATKAPEHPAVSDLSSFDLPTLDWTAAAKPTQPAPAVARPPPTSPPAAASAAPASPARTPPPAPSQSRPQAPPQSRAPAPAPANPPAPQPRAAQTPPAAASAAAAPARAPAPPARPPAPPARPPAAAPAAKKTTATPSPAALDFTAAVVVNNPFGQGEVQVDDLDFTSPSQSVGKGVPQGAPQLDVPATLKLGTWVKIREPGAKDAGVVAKLSFVSPLKTRYLFVDRQGKTVLQCSPVVLAKRYRDGEIVIEEPAAESPLFDRIMGGVVGKLRTAEAAPPVRPPAKVAK